MYTKPTFKFKKELKKALNDGKTVEVYSPGPFPCPQNGIVAVEGPAGKPHTWYANVQIKDGIVTKVLS